MGFLDDLVKDAALLGAVEASKDKNGKSDPYKATGIAAGMGNLSFSDRLKLGVMLGTQGAFDTNTGDDYSHSLSYGGTDDSWKLFCEEGSEHGIEPDDYDSEEEYEEVLSEAKESEENTEITLCFSVNCPALDKLNEIKREDYPGSCMHRQ